MSWWWRRRNGHDAKRLRAEAEESLRQAKSETFTVRHIAAQFADIDRDELVDRIAAAFDPDR